MTKQEPEAFEIQRPACLAKFLRGRLGLCRVSCCARLTLRLADTTTVWSALVFVLYLLAAANYNIEISRG